MTATPAPDTDPLALGRRIIDISQSGRKTSTYKLAVLRALIDACMERVPDDQHASIDVPSSMAVYQLRSSMSPPE
jgi:hypothetical protein